MCGPESFCTHRNASPNEFLVKRLLLGPGKYKNIDLFYYFVESVGEPVGAGVKTDSPGEKARGAAG